MDAYDLLCQAIQDKHCVACHYRGHYREMCPHVIGAKKGNRHVLSYQFGGSSSSGLPPEGEWRCMEVDGITDATLIEGEWHTPIRLIRKHRRAWMRLTWKSAIRQARRRNGSDDPCTFLPVLGCDARGKSWFRLRRHR